MPNINVFIKEDGIKNEKKYKLEVAFCPKCFVTQITEAIPPEDIFVEYSYLSSMSKTILEHAENISQYLTKKLHLNKNSLVVELASNDGYLLQFFQKIGINVL
jgi:hypothetical protein